MSKSPKNNPPISVIIPTFNRADMVEITLPSYLQSKLVKEVLLIDDGSNSTNQEKLLRIANLDDRVGIIHNVTNIGAPASRNRGIDRAKGDYILFSEDDLELGPDHLEILIEHMQSSGADIIAGRRIWMRIGETRENAFKRSYHTKKPVVDTRWLDHYSTAITPEDVQVPLVDATMLVKRLVTQKVRYYEPYGGSSTWREDTDFQIQALKLGFVIVFCPHVCSYHYPRASVSYGTNRLKGNINYLTRVYRNNKLFLERHQDYLEKEFPDSLINHNLRLTSWLYVLRRFFWLIKSEGLRWYLSRKQKTFTWK